jgi:SAM-dependent methyltransferase
MSLRTKFFALTYDRQMAKTEKAGLRAFRERLLARASGDVLEIGGGTGANLPCYGPAVRSLTITEPQPPMLRRLERNVRARRAGQRWPDARVLRAPAEDLPFDDDSFDVAVSTLVLCGVDDQPRRSASCVACCAPAAACCSSSTCGPVNQVRPACRTG